MCRLQPFTVFSTKARALKQVSATNGDYEDPYTTTCGSGEINATIENIDGAFCTPSCSVFMPCPSPTGFESFVDAQCMLQVCGDLSISVSPLSLLCHPVHLLLGSSHDTAPPKTTSGVTYCALVCGSGSAGSTCGPNATCKAGPEGLLICTYNP